MEHNFESIAQSYAPWHTHPSERTHTDREQLPKTDIEQSNEKNEKMNTGIDAETKRKMLSEIMKTARERIESQKEKLKGMELRPRVGILADAQKIENQQIDMIPGPDGQSVHISFKLTEEYWKSIVAKSASQGWEKSKITYGTSYHFVDCLEKKTDSMQIKISVGTRPFNEYNEPQQTEIRTAFGLVDISIQNDGKLTDEQIGETIDTILVTEFGVSTGLEAPTNDAEKNYKLARYAWHHKLSETPDGVEESLKREEVFPDYSTFVEERKHKEYQSISPYAVFHKIYSIENLSRIIQAGGLLSSRERYRRGLLSNGMSSQSDMRTGGGR